MTDDEADDKHAKKENEKEGEQKDERSQFEKFFFDQENNPKPENIIAIILALCAGYYLFTY